MIIGTYRQGNRSGDTIQLTLQQSDLNAVWRRCSDTSNYGAEYLAGNSPDRDRVYNMLSVILNELLENAVKHSGRRRNTIGLRLLAQGKQVTVQVDNDVTARQYTVFRRLAGEIAGCKDVNAAYLARLATLERRQTIGIGLLTVLSYYNMTCGFRFAATKQPGVYRVSVQAIIPLQGAAS